MSKDVWVKAVEKLEIELGRQPTDKEIEAEYQDMLSSQLDHAQDLREV